MELFGLMKEGSSFILYALLILKELGSMLAYLVTKSMRACFLSTFNFILRAFPLLSLELFALLASSPTDSLPNSLLLTLKHCLEPFVEGSLRVFETCFVSPVLALVQATP